MRVSCLKDAVDKNGANECNRVMGMREVIMMVAVSFAMPDYNILLELRTCTEYNGRYVP